jgi:hypothetical protein
MCITCNVDGDDVDDEGDEESVSVEPVDVIVDPEELSDCSCVECPDAHTVVVEQALGIKESCLEETFIVAAVVVVNNGRGAMKNATNERHDELPSRDGVIDATCQEPFSSLSNGRKL